MYIIYIEHSPYLMYRLLELKQTKDNRLKLAAN